MKGGLYQFIVFILFVGLLVGCAEEEDHIIQSVKDSVEETPDVSNKAEKVRRILYSVPSHIEMMNLVEDANIPFKVDFLNKSENAANYSTVKSQAFNLGVYGTDLAYISIFEQSQEVIKYFAAIKSLSDELGVADVITDENMARFEKYVENKDSLVLFISDIFYSIDQTLNEGDRGFVSAIVVSGGWIEAMHIMTSDDLSLEGPFKFRLKKIIADQRHSLDNIQALIEIYDNDQNLGDLLKYFNDLAVLYDEINITQNTTTVSKDENGKVIIGGEDEMEFSDELLQQIGDQIRTIRTNYIN